MAGAVFGEVQLSLFVAAAVFGEIWNDSRSTFDVAGVTLSAPQARFAWQAWHFQYLHRCPRKLGDELCCMPCMYVMYCTVLNCSVLYCNVVSCSVNVSVIVIVIVM